MAMAIARGTFEDGDTLLQMFQDPSKLPEHLPCELHFKPNFLEQAVFVTQDRGSPAGYDSIRQLMATIKEALGWERKSPGPPV